MKNQDVFLAILEIEQLRIEIIKVKNADGYISLVYISEQLNEIENILKKIPKRHYK